MARYYHTLIGELARQFAYTPRQRKLEQLHRLRSFAPRLDPTQSYPYDYILYQITRFRLDDAAHAVFDGASLKADLMTLLHALSDTLDLPMAWAGEPVLELDEVRRTYDVSLRTLRRWRAQGLVALRFLFPDGRKRTGVCQSDLEAFVETHREIIGRTNAYSVIDADARRAILARAYELSVTQDLTAAEGVGRLAREFGCSHDAVRSLVREQERSHPDAPIFPAEADPLSEAERLQLLALYRNGYQPGELARSFLLARSTVGRVVRDLVADEILGRDWRCVARPEFDLPGAEQCIVGLLPPEGPADQGLEGPLNAEEEELLFLQYNFLKHQLGAANEELTPSQLVPAQLERLVRLYDMAIAVRNRLAVANLRLVIHLASRHLRTGRRLDDLVSDGTVSLMQAIERFDYTRGVRFSTYASWAILKNFAKTLPRQHERHQMEATGCQELIDAKGDGRAAAAPGRDVREVLRSTVASLLLELSPREREVLVARYGLAGKEETLEQIGTRFQLTRERIRQIEAAALRKLAALVDPALLHDLAAPAD